MSKGSKHLGSSTRQSIAVREVVDGGVVRRAFYDGPGFRGQAKPCLAPALDALVEGETWTQGGERWTLWMRPADGKAFLRKRRGRTEAWCRVPALDGEGLGEELAAQVLAEPPPDDPATRK